MTKSTPPLDSVWIDDPNTPGKLVSTVWLKAMSGANKPISSSIAAVSANKLRNALEIDADFVRLNILRAKHIMGCPQFSNGRAGNSKQIAGVARKCIAVYVANAAPAVGSQAAIHH